MRIHDQKHEPIVSHAKAIWRVIKGTGEAGKKERIHGLLLSPKLERARKRLDRREKKKKIRYHPIDEPYYHESEMQCHNAEDAGFPSEKQIH